VPIQGLEIVYAVNTFAFQLHVLAADDDPVARRVLTSALERLGHTVTAVECGGDALAHLSAPDGPTLAILDWMMPEMDGLAVCRAVRQLRERYVYVLILTSRGGVEDMLEAFDAEADDFLVKPFDIGELGARVRVAERLLRLQAELRHQATHDALTGLPNRQAILTHLDAELHRARRHGGPVAVALADLDHFKHTNDTFGHLVGDEVLREAARRMRSAVRAYDYVGRYGGEEFLLVLPDCDSEQARSVAERVRAAVGDSCIDQIHRHMTLSVGVSSTAEVSDSGDALLSAADTALYRAKSWGRNCVAA
jgi:diguanylate cyclase (GGDEF)-like protein